jgi:hypothetical protein
VSHAKHRIDLREDLIPTGQSMQQIKIGSQLGTKLAESSGQIVLCDERGRVLDLFPPVHDNPHVEDLQFEPLLSIEETERLRKQNRTGKPLEEILSRLSQNR